MVGIVGSKLWVNTKAGRLLALDIETGEVLKVFSNDEEDKKYGYDILPLAVIFSKDGDDDYLYSLGLAFAKIDAHTMEVVERYDTENFEDDELLSGFESKLHMMHHELQGDYFTFHAYDEDVEFRYIGVYDYVKRKAVWVHELITLEESKKGNELISPQRAKMHGDKLYVKDFFKNLHVFEKEQTSV